MSTCDRGAAAGWLLLSPLGVTSRLELHRHMHMDVCVDLDIDVCMDMRMDMCINHVYGHGTWTRGMVMCLPYEHVCEHVYRRA